MEEREKEMDNTREGGKLSSKNDMEPEMRTDDFQDDTVENLARTENMCPRQ